MRLHFSILFSNFKFYFFIFSYFKFNLILDFKINIIVRLLKYSQCILKWHALLFFDCNHIYWLMIIFEIGIINSIEWFNIENKQDKYNKLTLLRIKFFYHSNNKQACLSGLALVMVLLKVKMNYTRHFMGLI